MSGKLLRLRLYDMIYASIKDNGYITKDLCVWLDRDSVDEKERVWRNKVGESVYEFYKDICVKKDCLVLDGEGFLICTKEEGVKDIEGTIEIVYAPTKNEEGILYCSPSGQLSFGCQNAGSVSYSFGSKTGMWKHGIVFPSPRTISVNANLLVVNCTSVNARPTGDKFGSNKDAFTIGSDADGKHALPCYLFCIRIYNRLLSEEEIKHNQAIDMAKYGIK